MLVAKARHRKIMPIGFKIQNVLGGLNIAQHKYCTENAARRVS